MGRIACQTGKLSREFLSATTQRIATPTATENRGLGGQASRRTDPLPCRAELHLTQFDKSPPAAIGMAQKPTSACAIREVAPRVSRYASNNTRPYNTLLTHLST